MSDVFLHVLEDPIGRWFVYIGAFVAFSGFGITIGRRIAKQLSEVAARLHIVQEQVENTHVVNPDTTSNLRDDLDQKHEVLAKSIGRLSQVLAANTETLADMGGRIGRIEVRLGSVESTQEKGKHHE